MAEGRGSPLLGGLRLISLGLRLTTSLPPPRELQGSRAGAGSTAPARLDLPGGARTSAPPSGTPSGPRLRTGSAEAAPPPSCPDSELPRPPPRRPC